MTCRLAVALVLPCLVAAPAAAHAQPSDVLARLAEARAAHDAAPDDADALIWFGRRTAYAGRYEEAIDIFTRGITKHPGDARMYRHRGHRYLTVRQFDKAVADFERAAALVEGKPDEVEPDGLPNARNIPTSTLQTNIYYHLGLAHYVSHRFERALEAYERCLALSKNADMQVATRHWLYMTLRRLGRTEAAAAVVEPVGPGMDIIENGAYYRLLLMYRGHETPDAVLKAASEGLDRATLGYGVGNWFLYNGDPARAASVFKDVLAAGQPASFGAIAAEADLARLTVP